MLFSYKAKVILNFNDWLIVYFAKAIHLNFYLPYIDYFNQNAKTSLDQEATPTTCMEEGTQTPRCVPSAGIEPERNLMPKV
ncbi:hypothetical protein MUGA111182_03380 [Mucilaginibacter galii]